MPSSIRPIAVVRSYKRGGLTKGSTIAKLHKGEIVISKAEMLKLVRKKKRKKKGKRK